MGNRDTSYIQRQVQGYKWGYFGIGGREPERRDHTMFAPTEPQPTHNMQKNKTTYPLCFPPKKHF